METSLNLLAWRAALADATPVPSVADLIEWAERLAASGQAAEAALLGDVAALHTGFSPRRVADRARPFGHAVPQAGDDMPARAVTELRQLGAAAAADAPAFRKEPELDGSTGGGRVIGNDVVAIVQRLHRLLEQPLADDGEELAATLDAAASRAWTRIDYRTFLSAPLTVLVPAIAAVVLADFALRSQDLWRSPTGSPALLHRLARLDQGGLGPCLTNVGRLVRNSRDVIALARIARDAEAEAGNGKAALEPWIALLVRGFGQGLLHEIVDDLGDAAARAALLAILERAAARPAAMIDVDLMMRLRDAGLDNADHGLAVRAQRIIARLREDSDLETVILGSIEASGGERAAAAATFRYVLARSPGNEEAGERLAALEAGRFEPFVISRGFGSPADRQEARLHRRGILPDRPRRRGEQIEAVKVH